VRWLDFTSGGLDFTGTKLASGASRGLGAGLYLGIMTSELNSEVATAREQQIRKFYADLEQGRAEACIEQLSAEATFEDPIFGKVAAGEVPSLIRFLCANPSPGRRFEVHEVQIHDHERATLRWTAHYIFPTTGRAVANQIETPMSFRDNRIASYADRFDLWRWMGMALGPVGVLFGWTPILQEKVRSTVHSRFVKFKQSQSSRSK
jgi:SnoaL-like domain